MSVRYNITKVNKQELIRNWGTNNPNDVLQRINSVCCGLNFKHLYEAFVYIYNADTDEEKEMFTSVIVIVRENSNRQEYADIVLKGKILPEYEGISVETALFKLMELAETGDAELL